MHFALKEMNLLLMRTTGSNAWLNMPAPTT